MKYLIAIIALVLAVLFVYWADKKREKKKKESNIVELDEKLKIEDYEIDAFHKN